jgi:hypothetical protein
MSSGAASLPESSHSGMRSPTFSLGVKTSSLYRLVRSFDACVVVLVDVEEDSELVLHALALHGREPQLLDRLLAAVVVVDGVVLLRAYGGDDVGGRVEHRVDERAVLRREPPRL